MKYAAIQKYHGKYPVQFMCNFFEVSRAGYYAFLKRQKQPDKDEALALAIEQCQQQTNRTKRYRLGVLWLKRIWYPA